MKKAELEELITKIVRKQLQTILQNIYTSFKYAQPIKTNIIESNPVMQKYKQDNRKLKISGLREQQTKIKEEYNKSQEHDNYIEEQQSTLQSNKKLPVNRNKIFEVLNKTVEQGIDFQTLGTGPLR